MTLPATPCSRALRTRLLAAALPALLVACAHAPVAPPPPQVVERRVEVPVPVVEPADQAARALLAYAERLRQMGPAELAAEAARKLEPDAPPAQAVPLALALASNHAPGDLARAQALLDAAALHAGSPGPGAAWAPLARLVAARVAEQRRLEDALERQQQQARDALRDSQRRIDQLSDKLDALRAIERSLGARGASSGASGARPNP